MPGRPVSWLDVFTDRPLTGNGLAVVHDADGMDEEAMRAFAYETQLSETSFIQSARAEGADYRNRIFLPTGEIPFAGHPSLGAAVAVAAVRGERRATYRQETGAGVQPIDVELEGTKGRASMLQPLPDYGPELDPADVLGRVGLAPGDVDERLGVRVVATGVPQVVACVRDEAALARCSPVEEAVRALTREHSAVVVYVAVVDGERAIARGFIGETGVEDPATGSAVGPLLGLAHARLGVDRLEVDQGRYVRRPSRLRCSLEDGGVRVGGDVVVLFEGTLHLDA